MSIRILFHDQDLLVVDKPPGLPTHQTLDLKRSHLVQLVREQLQLPLGLAAPHRLDRDTSGVMILTQTTAAYAHITEQFKSRTTEKFYLALASASKSRSSSNCEWSVQNYIAADKKTQTMRPVRAGGQSAKTDFKILASSGKGTPQVHWIEAKPATGRRHQIRSHLAESCLPILGDSIYGSLFPASRIMLHAYRLKFRHPISHEDMDFKVSPPADLLATAQICGLAHDTLDLFGN